MVERPRPEKVTDGSQHRKEIGEAWIGKIERGELRLMVALEQKGANVTARNIWVLEREPRIDHLAAYHFLRAREIVVIVAVGAAERHHSCHRITAPAGASGALLIVGAPGRHVAQRHPRQVADVDADLHRCRAAEDVNAGAVPLIDVAPGEINVLELHLMVLGLRERSIGAGGIELSGMLGRDQRHELGFVVPQRLDDRPAIKSLAGAKHWVVVGIKDMHVGRAAIDASRDGRDRPVDRGAASAAPPFAAEPERKLAREQAIAAVGQLRHHRHQAREPLLLEVLPERRRAQHMLHGAKVALVRANHAARSPPTVRHATKPDAALA